MIKLKQNTIKNFAVSLGLFAFSMPAFSNGMFQPYQTINPYSPSKVSLEENVVLIPAGTEIPVVTVSEIDADFLILGQTVSVMLGNDYYYDGKFVAPIGSTISGTVVKIETTEDKDKKLAPVIKFTNMRSPYGQTIPLSAKFKPELLTYVYNVDKSKNHDTLNKADNLIIPANTSMVIELEQPVTINAANAYRY